MIPAEHAEAGRRRRKVRTAQGELMVTPTKPITVTIDGRRETLRPDRDRLAPTHKLVTQRPEAFRACDLKDALTASELRVAVARSRSRPDTRRGTGPRTSGRPSWSLDVSRAPARLPRRGRRPTWEL